MIKKIENNLLMQNIWGVNKMFYGRCENGEYVNNFIYLSFFEILHIKKMCDKHFASFPSLGVHS